MNTKLQNQLRDTIKQVVQTMIQQEISEWPPVCFGMSYQPRRPESDPTAPQK